MVRNPPAAKTRKNSGKHRIRNGRKTLRGSVKTFNAAAPAAAANAAHAGPTELLKHAVPGPKILTFHTPPYSPMVQIRVSQEELQFLLRIRLMIDLGQTNKHSIARLNAAMNAPGTDPEVYFHPEIVALRKALTMSVVHNN